MLHKTAACLPPMIWLAWNEPPPGQRVWNLTVRITTKLHSYTLWNVGTSWHSWAFGQQTLDWISKSFFRRPPLQCTWDEHRWTIHIAHIAHIAPSCDNATMPASHEMISTEFAICSKLSKLEAITISSAALLRYAQLLQFVFRSGLPTAESTKLASRIGTTLFLQINLLEPLIHELLHHRTNSPFTLVWLFECGSGWDTDIGWGCYKSTNDCISSLNLLNCNNKINKYSHSNSILKLEVRLWTQGNTIHSTNWIVEFAFDLQL